MSIGPLDVRDVTTFRTAISATISFYTDTDAAQALLPPFFDLDGDPVVHVTHVMYDGVDYLGGRGYNAISIGVPARYAGTDGVVRAPYHPVLWESDPMPVLLGRELGGLAKIYGDVSDARWSDDSYRFELKEYGNRLIAGRLANLVPVDSDVLDQIKERGANSFSLGWKFIPSANGTSDTSYVTRYPGEFFWSEAWVGDGSLDFTPRDWVDAPISHALVEQLASLPQLGIGDVMVLKGRGRLTRSAVRRLS
jgi:hypothetical protein